MIPASFDYEVASSVDNATALLEQGGEDARLLAGGHSLLPMMKLRLARPSLLVDIGGLSELSYIEEDGDQVTVGALTRHHDLEGSSLLWAACPILAHTAGMIGDPQVRHRGTIGGSVAHGDPASDLPTVLLALEADLVIKGPSGERTVKATEFFKSVFETDLGDAEMLTEIRVPRLTSRQGWSYIKFNRRAQDWAIVGAAAVIDRANGAIDAARIALTNMGATPLRAGFVEAALAGAKSGAVADAARLAADGTSPPNDTNASAEYRRHLAQVLVRRAIEEALSR